MLYGVTYFNSEDLLNLKNKLLEKANLDPNISMQELLDAQVSYKIIDNTLNDDFEISYEYDTNVFIYNPKEKESVGYKINNLASKYVDTSIFVTHEIEVPIYKNKIIYKGEKKIEKYKVKLSAPNMYEMFSAHSGEGFSYWYLNTSQKENIAAAVADYGLCINEDMPSSVQLRVRVVGYVNKNMVVSSGRGTPDSPFVLK